MSIPKDFFDSLDPVEQETEIAGAFTEAMRTGGEVSTPSGLKVRIVEPPAEVRVTLRIEWDDVVRLAGLEPETWHQVATIQEINQAAEKALPGVLEAGLKERGL